MKKGYQLIEPAVLSGIVGVPKARDIAVALLSWLIDALREELKGQLLDVQLELIRAEYHGPYPAIGVHYEKADTPDVGPLIERTVTTLFQGRCAADFAAYVARAGRDWRKEADALLGP